LGLGDIAISRAPVTARHRAEISQDLGKRIVAVNRRQKAQAMKAE
jgi:hypothetical protein